ncbi:MAG TPA: hypothetical protein VFA63_18290 [Pseudonocardiaceae bacterium]|nr:hypothetical protein [Pseudonocardiaceae bacterium]
MLASRYHADLRNLARRSGGELDAIDLVGYTPTGRRRIRGGPAELGSRNQAAAGRRLAASRRWQVGVRPISA